MKKLIIIMCVFFVCNSANAKFDGTAIYVNDMDYVLGDVKQAFITNSITTTAQADNLIKGFVAMKVNGIRVPIFAEGLEPNKPIFDYFFNEAKAAGFKIFANPAQHSGGQRIACGILEGTFCTVLNNDTRTNILIDRIKDFADEYACDWVNPFNEDGAPGAAWSTEQMDTIYASLYNQLDGAELIGPGVWGLPAGISVLNNTSVSNYISVATSHNLGYNHASWPTFIQLAESLNLPVWDSETNNNVSEANNNNTTTRIIAAIAAGVDGLVLYNSWNYISLTDGSINNTGLGVMDYYLALSIDLDKTYYIDSPIHNLRLAATGESEDAYTTSTTTTGADVEWQFVSNGNGSLHIQRAAGGSKPRLRTDNTDLADMQSSAQSGAYTYYDITASTNTDGAYYLTLPDGPDGRQRLQVSDEGLVRFRNESLNGSWESFTITEVNTSNVVHITKRNASDFAIDGNNGTSNGVNILLWTANQDNTNQQWVEIDRGDGYYSYQKQGSNYCIDGNSGGADRQNVYLWTCAENNQNQHWGKVSTDSGFFQLVKRNAPGFALDGGSDGANGQNVQLFDSSNTSYNLQWSID